MLRETLVADPKNVMGYDLLGNLLSEFGRFDEARACFERAIAIAPLLAGSYYDLVRCRPVTSNDDGLLQQMEAVLATPGWKRRNATGFTSRIGKTADDVGDYALAMHHSPPRTRCMLLESACITRILNSPHLTIEHKPALMPTQLVWKTLERYVTAKIRSSESPDSSKSPG